MSGPSSPQSLGLRLKQCLGPEYISNRVGPGGTKLIYIEGKTAINLANELFGHNGWNSEVRETLVDFIDITEDGKVNLGIATTIRITLRDGTFHEDIGYGMAENMKGKAAAFEKARKESATDGLKRALRMFGNALGNCVYDKQYIRNINTMAKPVVPFIPFDLYRHEHIRKKIDAELTTPASSSSSKPTFVKKDPLKPGQDQQQKQPKQQQKTSFPQQQKYGQTVTPARSTGNTKQEQPELTNKTSKRQYEDDLRPELFSEDSFIIEDDEDDEFYAKIANGQVEGQDDDRLDIELLSQVYDEEPINLSPSHPQTSSNGGQHSTSSDSHQNFKRHRT